MNTTTSRRRESRSIRSLVPVALVSAALTILGGAAIAGAAGDHAPPGATPSAAECAQLEHDVELLPAYWPVTEAMRESAERCTDTVARALGTVTDTDRCAELRHDVELLPAYWPVTEVMRQSAERCVTQ